MSWRSYENGQYPDARRHFVQSNDGTLLEHVFVVFEHMENILPGSTGKYILRPHLEHARSFSFSSGYNGGKVEVMGKDDVPLLPRPSHDL